MELQLDFILFFTLFGIIQHFKIVNFNSCRNAEENKQTLFITILKLMILQHHLNMYSLLQINSGKTVQNLFQLISLVNKCVSLVDFTLFVILFKI